MASESAVARQMVGAFLLFPQDNAGNFMRGKGTEPRASVKGFDGETLEPGEEAAMRWTWKLSNLMPEGPSNLFTGEHQDYYQYLYERKDDYGLSLTPSLGMNLVFVGGNYRSNTVSPGAVAFAGPLDQTGSPKFPHDYCVIRPDIAYKPSEMIVFVSTLSDYAEGWEDIGYYIANPAHFPGRHALGKL